MNGDAKQIYEQVQQNRIELATQSEKLREVGEDMKTIKTNHLPHIYEAQRQTKNWIIGVLFTVVMTLIGVIIDFIAR